MIEMLILVLFLSPDGRQWRTAEVALPAGTPLVHCQGASGQLPAMIAAERATGWRAWDAKCIVRRPS